MDANEILAGLTVNGCHVTTPLTDKRICFFCRAEKWDEDDDERHADDCPYVAALEALKPPPDHECAGHWGLRGPSVFKFPKGECEYCKSEPPVGGEKPKHKCKGHELYTENGISYRTLPRANCQECGQKDNA